MAHIVSTKVLACYNGTDRPKFIQINYNNGQIDLIHVLKNGTSTKTMIHEPKLTFFEKLKKIF